MNRPAEDHPVSRAAKAPEGFRSPIVDQMRSRCHVLELPGGRLVLPRVFGFCRGVEHALEMLEQACNEPTGGRLFLLGQIIHNPWVNRYFEARGVQILQEGDIAHPEQIIQRQDIAVIPAFGVRPEVHRKLQAIGCRIINTSCGDVRRLWAWARKAGREGYGVLIFGRARHDETVVTKSLLAEDGSKYVIAGNLTQVRRLCRMIAGQESPEPLGEVFPPESTNAQGLEPFLRLAQVSQTTMLYNETMQVRDLVQEAFRQRFGPDLEDRLLFQPTVCRATQDRQAAAVELCRSGCDLVIVVGGYGSSNTHHLYELAGQYSKAYFIEDASAIVSATMLRTMDFESHQPVEAANWLPAVKPLRIGVLAGASTPECVVGQVLERLAEFLS